MIMYRVSTYFGYKIHAHEIVRETEHTVVVKDPKVTKSMPWIEQWRENKVATDWRWFHDLEAAKLYVVDRIDEKLQALRSDIADLEQERIEALACVANCSHCGQPFISFSTVMHVDDKHYHLDCWDKVNNS